MKPPRLAGGPDLGAVAVESPPIMLTVAPAVICVANRFISAVFLSAASRLAVSSVITRSKELSTFAAAVTEAAASAIRAVLTTSSTGVG